MLLFGTWLVLLCPTGMGCLRGSLFWSSCTFGYRSCRQLSVSACSRKTLGKKVVFSFAGKKILIKRRDLVLLWKGNVKRAIFLWNCTKRLRSRYSRRFYYFKTIDSIYFLNFFCLRMRGNRNSLEIDSKRNRNPLFIIPIDWVIDFFMVIVPHSSG